jgi:hypothetical protein
MKLLTTMFAVLSLTALLNAGNFAPRPIENAGYSGRGGKASNGIEGTVGEMGSSGFTMTVMTAGKDSKSHVMKVQCDRNTKFMSGGQQVSPSTLKAGAHVAVQGGQSGNDLIMATTVTIGEAHKGK